MSFTLWFMGLPASGKSTLAKRTEEYLRERRMKVENLDGDELRKNIHPDLGFTREEREINNRRTAFICKLLNRNGISVVTGMITPFRDSQQKVKEIIEPEGNYVLIYVKCPVEECADRDPKGMYEKAKEGKIENFTGINHPFEEPLNPDVVIDTLHHDVEESVDHVVSRLGELGVFEEQAEGDYSFDLSKSEEEEIRDRLRTRGYID
ncbi:MAG: adenylyl-sulfate kinase [Halobacteria archaeon]